jgi:hypothetical protein
MMAIEGTAKSFSKDGGVTLLNISRGAIRMRVPAAFANPASLSRTAKQRREHRGPLQA